MADFTLTHLFTFYLVFQLFLNFVCYFCISLCSILYFPFFYHSLYTNMLWTNDFKHNHRTSSLGVFSYKTSVVNDSLFCSICEFLPQICCGTFCLIVWQFTVIVLAKGHLYGLLIDLCEKWYRNYPKNTKGIQVKSKKKKNWI